MVPKSWRRAPLILVGISAALALAGGCSPHAHLGAELAASQTGCLNGIGEAIQGYWNATNLDDGKIARYAQCAHESLRLFYEKSSGSVAGQYSPGELVNFLESNEFVKPKTITPAIQLRAMELKQLLLGGSLHALTIAELKGVQEWIEKLRQINSSLKPFYVALARPDKTEERELEIAESSLSAAADEIGATLDRVGTPYSFNQLRGLLDDVHWPGTEMIKNQLHNLQILKGILIAPDQDQIRGNQWTELLSASARGYGIYLKFGYLNRHFSASGSWTKGDGRRVFGEVIRESIHFLEDQIRKKPGQVLTFDELNLLLVALEPLRPESLEVSTPTLQAALKPVIKKLLGGGPYAKGLTVGVLENVNASIEHWHYGQKYLERLFDWLAVRGGVQSSYVRSELLLPELEDLLVEKPKGAELDAISKIQEMIADPRERPLFEDSEGAVSFSQIPFADYERHTFYDLTQMNWMHEVVRAMLRAYSDDGRSEQVSNVKLQEFYNDFRDVGIEEKLFDPFDEMAAQKRFTEANLFTYAANGDGYIDVQEGSQLLAFMISGEQLAGQIRREITAVCRDPENQFDIYGKAMMRTDCFRREFFEGANRYWKFMPRMADYYRRLDWIGKKRFEHAFEAAARKKGFSSDKIDSADCEGFAMIAHYSESLFARWDSNLSGDIDEKEAEAMFPVFRNTILEVWQKRVRGVKPTEGRLKAAFTYILGKGEIPDASHFKDKLKFIFWDLGSQKFTADRGRILQIFADLGMLEEMPNTP